MNAKILESDRYYKLLTEEQKFEICKKAQSIASNLCKSYDMDKVKKRLKDEGFQILKVQNNSETFKYRARIDIAKNKKIYIYEDSIYDSLHKFHSLSYQDLYDMYLAHEFFHFLEYQNEVDTVYYVEKKSMFGKRKHKILALGEIAASLFAEEMAGAQVSSEELDQKEVCK